MSGSSLSAEELFERHFAPLYPKEARADLARVRTTDANPAKNPAILAKIDEMARVFAHLAPAALGAPGLALDFSDASVHSLGAVLDRDRRDALLAAATEPGGPPLLVSMVTHGVLYVGACIEHNHGGVFLVRRPLWESLVRLKSPAGIADLAVFQWWLKALSDDEITDNHLGDRYRTHVEVPTFDAAGIPVIAPESRKLPRLAKVRYDLLYKHLRAHLPELRDLGADFPSPERFEELGFKWLDMMLVGGGKMLLMHGPTDYGVHLFWLDHAGFVKSAFYAADPFPSHRVEAVGKMLRVLVSVKAKLEVHETLWWGA